MPKLGEINYLKALGPAGGEHALGKPFADGACPRYLADVGLVLGLLPPPPARVLDLGVGSGWTTAFLARRGYEALGRDICPDMIELAERNRRRYSAAAAFEVGDYESMPYRDEFDAALFYDSLHHAEDELGALAAACAALKPGGVCVTVEPGEGHAAASAGVAGRFGVTEKDMPPRHIISLGRRVGFREFRVYPRPVPVPRPLAEIGPADPVVVRPVSRWRAAAGFARKALRALVSGVREGDAEFLFRLASPGCLRVDHVVWMRKG